ncbi:hypothetical protein LTS02_013205 [Friedmanniomyces endolithicus]|nr:hypothetical protein LTS02_013205 [Friedmanniomyces endolithicus]
MGHEMSGTVVEVGHDVEGIEPGQRVCVNPATGCEHQGRPECELCVAGRRNICTHSAFYGLQHAAGGFASEICVAAIAVVPLPDNVSLKLGALAEPLAVAAHMIRISGFSKGQRALVLGAGPIGCALTLLLKEAGARCILVSEVTESRSAQASACGADEVVNPIISSSAVLDATMRLMAPGADVAFDACGIQTTFDEAFACTKLGGTIFNVAIHEKALQIDLNRLVLSEKRLLAGNAYTAEDFANVLRLLERRGSDIESFITAVIPLENAVQGGFDELVNNKARHSKILIEVNGEEVNGEAS